MRTVVVTFMVTLATILCMVWWPLTTAVAAAVVMAIGGVWAVSRP